MRRKLLLQLISAYLVLFSFALNLHAQESKEKEIDKLMTYCYDNDLFNGTILVAEKGNIIYQKAFGYANFETMEKLVINSSFCLASVSKTFTSMAIMILKERNKLTYEDKLSDYLPEFPDYAQKVTIRHLLTHTAGIANWTGFPEFRARPGDFLDDITNRDVLNFLFKQESLNFEPVEKYSYSNSGYLLLASIVEKASGEPFHIFMKKNIFGPLGMNNTLVFDESKPEIRYKTIGHTPFGDKDDYNILTSGAGGIYSTVEDLYKWDRALYTEKLITQKTLQEAFTPALLNNGKRTRYGYGWVLRGRSSNKIVMHDGGFNGFSTNLYRELDNDNVVIYLTNKGQTALANNVLRVILNVLHGRSYKFPKIPISNILKKISDESSIEKAIGKCLEMRKTHAADYDFSERQLNSFGYFYMNKKKYNEAKAVFKLNIDMYPKSSNTYDSYAEACMMNSDYAEAIKHYKRALELNPDNTTAVEMIKRINEKLRNDVNKQ